MGKGKIILIAAVLLAVTLFGFWKWAYKGSESFALAPPPGCLKKDVEDIFGQPFYSRTFPDNTQYPGFSFITFSIYNIHKDLSITVTYDGDKVIKSDAGLGFGRFIEEDAGVLEKLNQLKDEVKYNVKLDQLLEEAAPGYLAAIEKLKKKYPSEFKRKILLDLPIIKNAKGEKPYWEKAIFIDRNNEISKDQKRLDCSLQDFFQKPMNFANFTSDLFVDKNLLFDHDFIDFLKKEGRLVNFAGYNPESKTIESHSFYNSKLVDTPSMKKLPVLNFELNAYKYKFGDEELSIVDIDRFFERPEYLKGRFRVEVEVVKGSTYQEVFHFFNAVPPNMYVHVK